MSSFIRKIPISEPPYGGIKGNINALPKRFDAKKNFVAEFYQDDVSFICKTAK